MSNSLDTVRASFPGVELVAVGDWNGVKGKAPVDAQDIADMIAAATDPMIDHSPIKFGHFSTLGDGEPAPGWVENIRANEDGTKAVGDITGVPSRLVPLIRTGFRRRSVELKHNVTGSAGKVYKSTLKALALLGVEAPAVKGLNELADLYASEIADTDVDAIYLGEAPDSDTPSVPHLPSAGGNDSNNEPNNDSTNSTSKEALNMALKDTLLAKYNLPATATDEEIEAAVTAAVIADPAAAPVDPAAPVAPVAPAVAPVAPAVAVAPVAPVLAPAATPTLPDTVTVSRAVYEKDQASLRRLEERADNQDRTAELETALAEGRIAPEEVTEYETLLSEAPEAGRKLLAKLPQRFATKSVGIGGVHQRNTEAEEKEMHAAADAAGL